MRTEASGGGHIARPPQLGVAHSPGASVRPTARIRPVVPVRSIHRETGYAPSDPYVRRFWVAAIGSSAVAECLRLIRAAEKGEGVRLPRTLPSLLRAGLAQIESAGILVVDRFPEVPVELRWRFPPALGLEHSVLGATSE
jgi:hypothetical protein